MALALAKSLSLDYELQVIGRDETKLKEFVSSLNNAKISLYDGEFSLQEGLTLVCVKPYALAKISKYLKNKEIDTVLSILAGTSISDIKKELPTVKNGYFRLMPNIACEYNKSTNILTGENRNEDIINICKSFGNTVWVDSENELDIATAIAGSGPAFLALIAEAIEDAGVNCGLKRVDSNLIAKSLFESFDALIKNKKPRNIIEEVTSPNGTTARGLKALEVNNTRYSIMSSIIEAYNRTQE